MNEGRQTLERLASQNIYAFVRLAFVILFPGERFKNTPHVEAICFVLERVARGECKRLIITVPPRYLKSVTVAVAFCAWWLGHNPNHKIMIANYSETIAAKHGRMFRALIRRPPIQARVSKLQGCRDRHGCGDRNKPRRWAQNGFA